MDYVSQVALEINAQTIEDFKKVREGQRTLRKQVKLMRKVGTIKTTPMYTIGVDYAIPMDGAEFDFESVVNGTLTIDQLNGKRITYSGVSTLEIGDTDYDEDNEAIRPILLGATGRVEE